MRHIAVIAGDTQRRGLAVAQHRRIALCGLPLRVEAIQPAKIRRERDGLVIRGREILRILERVLAYLEAYVAELVRSAAGVPALHVPGQYLIACHAAVGQLADNRVRADVASAGLILVERVAVRIHPQPPVIRLHIPLEIGVVRAGAVHHHAARGYSRAGDIALVLGRHLLIQVQFISLLRYLLKPQQQVAIHPPAVAGDVRLAVVPLRAAAPVEHHPVHDAQRLHALHNAGEREVVGGHLGVPLASAIAAEPRPLRRPADAAAVVEAQPLPAAQRRDCAQEVVHPGHVLRPLGRLVSAPAKAEERLRKLPAQLPPAGLVVAAVRRSRVVPVRVDNDEPPGVLVPVPLPHRPHIRIRLGHGVVKLRIQQSARVEHV